MDNLLIKSTEDKQENNPNMNDHIFSLNLWNQKWHEGRLKIKNNQEINSD